MANAVIKMTIPGMHTQNGMTLSLWTHPGSADVAAASSGASLVADSVNTDTYWTAVNATSLSGVYLAEALLSGVAMGVGYVKVTNTTNTHVVVSSPWQANIDGTYVNADVAALAGSAVQQSGGYIGIAWDKVGAPTSTVVLSDTTISTVTINPLRLVRTTIAVVNSQTSFTLSAGSADDDAYNGLAITLEDQVTAAQKCIRTVTDYVGATKTVTLDSAPVFTIAAGDTTAVLAFKGQIGVTKNTALANFEFLMLDSGDHVSPKTGLTVAATRSIDGGAFASCANSVSEVSNGIYKISLAATDLNGDVITLKFAATGADTRLVTIRTAS